MAWTGNKASRWIATLACVAVFAGFGCRQRDAANTKGDGTDVAADTGEYDSIWIGINGRSKGAGVLGHAYVLFGKSGQPKDFGLAYHYYVTNTKRASGNILGLEEYLAKIGLAKDFGGLFGRFNSDKRESIPTTAEQPYAFVVKRELFIDTKARASILEDRNIFLFRLRFSQDQITRLRKALDTDYADRIKNPRFDYSLLRWNCLHALIAVINGVLDDSGDGRRKIVLNEMDLSDLFVVSLPTFDFTWKNAAAWANFIPVALMYYLDNDRPDLVFKGETSRDIKDNDDLINNHINLIKTRMDHLVNELKKPPYEIKLRAEDQDIFKSLFSNNWGSYGALRIFYENVFLKAQEKGVASYQPRLHALIGRMSCQFVASSEKRIHPDDRHFDQNDPMVILYRLDPDMAKRRWTSLYEIYRLRIEDESGPENWVKELGSTSVYKNTFNLLERGDVSRGLGPCSSEDRVLLATYLDLLLERNALYIYFKSLVVTFAISMEVPQDQEAERDAFLKKLKTDYITN